jgi:hypothetical protein
MAQVPMATRDTLNAGNGGKLNVDLESFGFTSHLLQAMALW